MTLNECLDYYGEAVNLAARLEGQGEAGDIIMSRAFGEDPAVGDMFNPYPLDEQVVDLKGFGRPIGILRVKPQNAHE